MNKSPLKILILVSLVVLLLIPLHWLPALKLGDYDVKRISIVSDILPELATSKTESLPALPPLPPIQKRMAVGAKTMHKMDTVPKGLVQILDYDDGDGFGMSRFYKALERRKTLGRPVRIAYLGDSFIESDMMTSSLRTQLQQKFGGRGVGFVDMAPPYASMRTTVRQTYDGWIETNILQKGSFNSRYLNISQRFFTPDSIAWTDIRGVSLYGLDSTDVHTMFLCTSGPHTVNVTLDKGPVLKMITQGTAKVEALTLYGRAQRSRWLIPSGNQVKCFGVAEESRSGLILDNFSLRGSSGMQLSTLSEINMKQWNAVRPYDLIVLQFGLNVANKNQTNYSSYISQMKKVIERMKVAFPQSGFLIVGVGDRGSRNENGEITTMPGIVALSHYQQNLAAETHVAFWNLYEAMGGEGAMGRMAEAYPVEAAKDYTHITHKGGKRVSTLLYKSMIYGYEQSK